MTPIVQSLTQEIEELVSRLSKRDQQIDMLERENKLLREAIASLKGDLFGKKSERIDPGQLLLFEQQREQSEDPAQAATIPVAEHQRKKKGHGREGFADHLPRKVVMLDLTEDEKCCPSCGSRLREIGEDRCERGHIIPAQVMVICYVKKKYACPAGHCVRTPMTPPSLIDRCKYEPSVYAHIVASKYQDHLPLHRLQGIFKRQGVNLSKQTMWEMLARVDEVFAALILKQMRLELLSEWILQGDDTPVCVRLEDGKGTREGRVWAWITLGAKKAVCQFTMTKERDGPVQFLGDWSGTLIFDGASNVSEVVRSNKIIRAGCWAHARRKFKKAYDIGSKPAVRLLIPIQRLFELERTMNGRIARQGLGDEALLALRRSVRERSAKRLADKIFKLAKDLLNDGTTLPRSEFGKGLKYLINQEEPLRRFLDDERIPIHNNDTERTLRHIAVGRANWLVFGSPRGGQVASNLYSLMLSCRASGINPEAYLTDVLSHVATTPISALASLTPWAWAEAHPEARIEK